MSRVKPISVAAILALTLAGCAGPGAAPLVDPSAVRFPLVEAGTLDIDGHVAGQPLARDGIVYFATREGFLTAVVAPARQVLWRLRADRSVSASPEIGQNHILLRDDGNELYVVDFKGALILRRKLAAAVTSALREHDGSLFFGTADGRAHAFDISADGGQQWERQAVPPGAALTAGPVFAAGLVLFGSAAGRLIALDQTGKTVWEFSAEGAIAVDPSAADGRLYFGTQDRFFYCLDLATGKKRWSRRLQGAPLHPALAHGRRLAVPASNSVVYVLSRRGGSILSWEEVPSRIVHRAAAAGPVLLVSSAGPSLAALDFATGKRVGQHLVSGPLAAGALWVPPFVVLAVEDEDTGRQRLVFLRPRPFSASAAPGERSSGS